MHDPQSTDAAPHAPAPHAFQIPVRHAAFAPGTIDALKRANGNVRQGRYALLHEYGSEATVRAHLDAAVEDLRHIARGLGVEL